MKSISVNNNDSLFEETVISLLMTSRNRNKKYNKVNTRKLLENKLKLESELVKNNSISVLNDFERLT